MSEVVQEYKKKYQIIRPSMINELAHGATVSNLAWQLGKKMDFSEEDCHDLAVAGFLHDIGKLELAKYVRGKEDKTLIIEEMRYVRSHPQLGAAILQKKGYSQKIVDMVKSHHENCDGSGYPLNLTREDIPVGARILRICDVFAALTADRPYRMALEPKVAMETMIEESRYYDVRIFMAFMGMVNTEDISAMIDAEDFVQQLRILVNNGYSPFARYEAL